MLFVLVIWLQWIYLVMFCSSICAVYRLLIYVFYLVYCDSLQEDAQVAWFILFLPYFMLNPLNIVQQHTNKNWSLTPVEVKMEELKLVCRCFWVYGRAFPCRRKCQTVAYASVWMLKVVLTIVSDWNSNYICLAVVHFLLPFSLCHSLLVFSNNMGNEKNSRVLITLMQSYQNTVCFKQLALGHTYSTLHSST